MFPLLLLGFQILATSGQLQCQISTTLISCTDSGKPSFTWPLNMVNGKDVSIEGIVLNNYKMSISLSQVSGKISWSYMTWYDNGATGRVRQQGMFGDTSMKLVGTLIGGNCQQVSPQFHVEGSTIIPNGPQGNCILL